MRQLLNQTSGYKDYLSGYPLVLILGDPKPAFADVVDTTTQYGLGFEPGSRFEYSNTNYASRHDPRSSRTGTI